MVLLWVWVCLTWVHVWMCLWIVLLVVWAGSSACSLGSGVGMDVYLLTAFCMCYVCCGYAWVSTSSNGVHYVCIKGSP